MKGQDLLLLLKLVSLARAEVRPLASRDDRAGLAGRVAEGPPAYGDGPDPYSVRALEESTGISKSEVSGALRRCTEVGLLKASRHTGKPQVNTRDLHLFLVHGVRFVFPARPGPIVRGIPTAFAAPVLADRLMSAGDYIHVWEDAFGADLGQRVEPLFRTAPLAAKRDPDLYAMLALVDSIRLGQAREAGLAGELLKKYLRGEVIE